MVNMQAVFYNSTLYVQGGHNLTDSTKSVL